MAINYRGKEATSTWTSRRQSFHSSVPLILPTILPNKRFLPFVYKFCTKFITPSSIHHSIKIASIQQNFSNYLKNYFQDISKSRETLLLRKIQNTLSRVVSLSLSLLSRDGKSTSYSWRILERASHMEVSKARIRNGINIESPRSLETWPPCTFGRNGEWEKDRVRERERWMKARPGKSEPSNSGRSFKLCRGFVLKIVRPTFLYPLPLSSRPSYTSAAPYQPI